MTNEPYHYLDFMIIVICKINLPTMNLLSKFPNYYNVLSITIIDHKYNFLLLISLDIFVQIIRILKNILIHFRYSMSCQFKIRMLLDFFNKNI